LYFIIHVPFKIIIAAAGHSKEKNEKNNGKLFFGVQVVSSSFNIISIFYPKNSDNEALIFQSVFRQTSAEAIFNIMDLFNAAGSLKR